ncbi:MAG: hypothetical protein NWF00_10515 [Candidatus Bathyarchaeota archaeon]|nr:hypothetical protein [Candidatus Bathyarchaeota archaeon]
MCAAESSTTVFSQYLELFAHTEIFIFVFMEIATKLAVVQRVMFTKTKLNDYAVFVVLFGLFSIFGTYIGIADNSGAISNIRDLAPMIAGLVGGPVVGLAVGLIGGIHRLFLGGVSAVPCALATILAGVLAGMVFRLNKGKLLGIIPAIIFAVGIEVLHAGFALLLISPFSLALDIVVTNIPPMIVAVSLGVGISVIIIHSVKESLHLGSQKTVHEEAASTVSRFARKIQMYLILKN